MSICHNSFKTALCTSLCLFLWLYFYLELPVFCKFWSSFWPTLICSNVDILFGFYRFMNDSFSFETSFSWVWLIDDSLFWQLCQLFCDFGRYNFAERSNGVIFVCPIWVSMFFFLRSSKFVKKCGHSNRLTGEFEFEFPGRLKYIKKFCVD